MVADRYDLLKFAFARAPNEGLVVEFGVAKGASLRLLASQTSRTVHGFDSFGGLPEDWAGTREQSGAFTARGKLPKVPGNVQIHSGWFDRTLPAFIAVNPGPCAFIHVDCDIYTSTVTIFQALRERILPGTVIVFDEYFNYPGWRGHEFKAFQEFIKETGLSYKYIGLSGEKGHVAVAIV